MKLDFGFASMPTISPVRCRSSLVRYDIDTSVGSLCPTDGTGLLRHENMVGFGIDGDAMRVGVDRKIKQELVRSGIDDAHLRRRHVAPCEIVLVVGRGVPSLVYGAGIEDLDAIDDRRWARNSAIRRRAAYIVACCVRDDKLIRWKRLAVVVGTAHQEVIARPLNDACRHAIVNWATGNDNRTGRALRIDHIYVSDGQNSSRVRVCKEKVARVWVPGMCAQACGRNRADAVRSWLRCGIAQRIAAGAIVDDRAVMAGNGGASGEIAVISGDAGVHLGSGRIR